MSRVSQTAPLVLAVCAVLGGCAGSPPPADIVPGEVGGDTPIYLDVEAVRAQMMVREPHPDANASFVTIGGVPYYRIGPEDRIQLTVWLQEGPATLQLEVRPSGEVVLPRFLPGEHVPLGGLALPQAEFRLTQVLGRVLREPRLALEVTDYRAHEVTLIGEVATRSGGGMGTGVFYLQGRSTLLEFLYANAAPAEQGDISSILVTDAQGRRAVYDLTRAIYDGDESQNPVLDGGDRVLVPSFSQTRQRIYVVGEVQRPLLLASRPGMTLLDALVEAGGPGDTGSRHWVTLVRGRGENAQKYDIPYGRITADADLRWNIPLQPGDIIHVGRSQYRSVMQFFRDTWQILQTAFLISVISS